MPGIVVGMWIVVTFFWCVSLLRSLLHNDRCRATFSNSPW